MKPALPICMLALLCLPLQLLAELPQYLSTLDDFWQYGVRNVCAQGDYIYTGHHADGLRVLDASDPQDIQELMTLECHLTGEIECTDSVLCAMVDDHVDIYSLQNPAQPEYCASSELDFEPHCFTVEGDRLVIAGFNTEQPNGFDVICFFDISDPQNPDPELYYTNLVPGSFEDMKLRGDRLYIASGDPYATVIDFSNPESPDVRYSICYHEYPLACCVEERDGYIYVGVGMEGIHIYDEETLELLATCSFVVRAEDLKVEGDRLYVSTWRDGRSFCVLDMTYPTTPALVNEFSCYNIGHRFAMTDDLVVIAEESAGVSIHGRAGGDEFVDLGNFSRCTPLWDCRGQEDLLVVREVSGLRLMDLSTPLNCQELSYLQLASTGAMLLDGDLAYVQRYYPRKLVAVDIHEPATPMVCASYEDDRIGRYAMARCGEWLVVTQPTSLLFFNHGDVDEIVLQHEISTGLSNGTSLVAAEEVLIVRDTSDGRLAVYDCSGSSPHQVQLLDIYCDGLSLAANRVYCESSYRLYLAELGAPGEEIEFQLMEGMDPYRNQNVLAAGDEMMLMSYTNRNGSVPADHYQRLGVFDNSDPMAPELLDYMVVGPEDCRINVFEDNLTLCYDDRVELYDVSQILLNVHGDTPSPSGFVLHNCAPNPFNPSTTVRLSCARAGRVELVVVDLLGRRVARLADREFAAGEHRLNWDGRDTHGALAASGNYFLLARFPDGSQVQPITLLK